MTDEKSRMLEQIYEEFYSQIYNYVFYQLLHREKTEDLVSRIFLKVVEHLDDYDPDRAKMSTWIFRIAKNTLTDYFRTHRVLISLDRERTGETPTLTVDFETEYNRIMEPGRRAVYQALAQLNRRDRMILYYVYFQGMSYRETAGMIGISESTLASALMRAKQKLRASMEETGEWP